MSKYRTALNCKNINCDDWADCDRVDEQPSVRSWWQWLCSLFTPRGRVATTQTSNDCNSAEVCDDTRLVLAVEIVSTPKQSDEDKRQQLLKKQQGVYYDFRHREHPQPIEYVTLEVFKGVIEGCLGKSHPTCYLNGQYWIGDTHLRVCPDGRNPTWNPPAAMKTRFILDEFHSDEWQETTPAPSFTDRIGDTVTK